MYRTSIRKYSTQVKNIPYQSKPINKYNADRSIFNFKPAKITESQLIHNPSQSSPYLKQTPKAFLPENDPRRKYNLGTKNQKTFTQQELDDMPIIYAESKDKVYDVTPDIVLKINELRKEDPVKWTISKLAKEFNIEQRKINYFTYNNKVKQDEDKSNLEIQKQSWNERKVNARIDRLKRAQMWLRNEY